MSPRDKPSGAETGRVRHSCPLYRKARQLAARVAALASAAPAGYQFACETSLDHLIGARKERLRHRKPERLGGLEIDHQLECGRPLDRQIGGLGPLKDPSGIDAGLAVCAGEARTIADEAARRGEFTCIIDRAERRGVQPTPRDGRVRLKKNASAPTTSAPACNCTSVSKAASISRSTLAFRIWS